jgi:DNA-binding response OmpR family regulator
MKLLIVDDDINIIKLLKVFLKNKGFEILESYNGNEAFEIVMKEQPDIAIIDGLIPGIHGFELSKKIKEEPRITKKPKIILMTGVYRKPQYKTDVIGTYHADEYLTKPFRKEQLISLIDRLLKD